ncbi:wall-associated receptor kinase 2-like [Argentina anserina]|uniref:wall-associated receptor kinase 2-like n=1 Tax=Argentina anserina TaxID=57926 RepID=UPI0021762B92|nr:wall-associated receptor kinase 2-like [Potentilla anserina]
MAPLLRMLLMQLCLMGVTAIQTLPPRAKPNCIDRCGNVTIPYPFGVGDDCYLPTNTWFNLICNLSTTPPSTHWSGSPSITITDISLAEAELQIMVLIAKDCYNHAGNSTLRISPRLWVPPAFTISGTKNKFIAVGCDTHALFRGYRRNEKMFRTGCMSICDDRSSISDSCSGIGCCETAIPSGLKNRTIVLSSYYNHTYIMEFNPCSYAFIVQDGQFNFSAKTSFEVLNTTKKLPMILDWEIGEGPCDAAKKRDDYACSVNSKCINRNVDVESGKSGYYCQCFPGFEGNPYLNCSDINECNAEVNPCENGRCENRPPGNYSCTCDSGYKKDGLLRRCIPYHKEKNTFLQISLGVSIGFLVLLVVVFCIYWKVNEIRLIKLKEMHFKQNGGLMLQEQIRAHGGGMETPNIYTAEELKKATNNYHEDEILGEGGYGTVFKGVLRENKVVAIKKSKAGAPTQSEQFVNEVIILSQINHRNVVKLLGCCFETEVPLLVYEYITHGTLSEHIFNKEKGSSSLSWELRLKIASESAGALAYLHSSASVPIIHRDVKTTNILLDDSYTAKVSDFGASRFIPLDQAQLETLVQGTLGYLDPEYFHTSELTEKSDVYSFGVVLAELLTSRVALSFSRPEKERCLANFLVSSIENDCLIEILDADIVNEKNIETAQQVAYLARRCLSIKGEERPTMKEVAMELEGMQITGKHPWVNSVHSCPEETEYLLGSPINSEAYVGNVRGDVDHKGSSATTSGYDSMQIQMLMPYEDGR